MVGLLTLAIAGAWIYAAWFPADKFMTVALFRTELNQPGGILGSSGLFGAPPPELANPTPPEGEESVNGEEEEGDEPAVVGPTIEELRTEARRITTHLVADMMLWLTVMTVAGYYLAFSAGAAISGLPTVDHAKRRPLLMMATILAMAGCWIGWRLWNFDPVGWGEASLSDSRAEIALAVVVALVSFLLAATLPRSAAGLASLLLLVALGCSAVWVLGCVGAEDQWVPPWKELNRGYPIEAPRFAALAGLAIAVLAGTQASRHLKKLRSVANWVVCLAVLSTVVAIVYADQFGGFQQNSPGIAVYGKIALAQLAYIPVVGGALLLKLR